MGFNSGFKGLKGNCYCGKNGDGDDDDDDDDKATAVEDLSQTNEISDTKEEEENIKSKIRKFLKIREKM